MGRKPKAKGTSVVHGSSIMESDYNIIQREYIGADCEDEPQYFMELLEIKNPPPGKNKAVIHIFIDGEGRTIHNFKTVAAAEAAWESKHRQFLQNVNFKGAKGFKRTVKCGYKLPWFYQKKRKINSN